MKKFSLSGLGLLKEGLASFKEYEDTLKRLTGEGFGDLSSEERRERVEQIIQAAAVVAMATGPLPIPFLEVPVLVAMVQVIGKIHGKERSGKRIMMELIAALGGGILLRQVIRFLPFGGAATTLPRIYGSTWALGRAADLFFSKNQTAPGEMRKIFKETLDGKTQEKTQGMKSGDILEKLEALDELRSKKQITEEEYQVRRTKLLALE